MNTLWLKNVCLALVCGSTPVWAQPAATVERLTGQVQYRLPQGSSQPVREGQDIAAGATILTGPTGEVHLLTQDGGYLALRPNSEMVLQRYQATPDAGAGMELGLLKGALRSISGWIGKLYPGGYKISTPTATVGIRGTDHEVSVLEHSDGEDPPGTYDSVREGATVLRNHGGTSLELEAGQDGFVGVQPGAEPHRLGRRPGFLLRRLLQLDDRIEERREAMAERLEAFARAHPERAQKLRERWGQLTPQQKDKARDALRNSVQRRRTQP